MHKARVARRGCGASTAGSGGQHQLTLTGSVTAQCGEIFLWLCSPTHDVGAASRQQRLAKSKAAQQQGVPQATQVADGSSV